MNRKLLVEVLEAVRRLVDEVEDAERKVTEAAIIRDALHDKLRVRKDIAKLISRALEIPIDTGVWEVLE